MLNIKVEQAREELEACNGNDPIENKFNLFRKVWRLPALCKGRPHSMMQWRDVPNGWIKIGCTRCQELDMLNWRHLPRHHKTYYLSIPPFMTQGEINDDF